MLIFRNESVNDRDEVLILMAWYSGAENEALKHLIRLRPT